MHRAQPRSIRCSNRTPKAPEAVMRDRLLTSMLTRAFAVAAVGAVVSVSITRTSARAPLSSTPAAAPDRIQTTPASKTPALKTPWGEPELQGIWTQESDIPLQRLAKYGLQEFFTEAQRTELDRDRAALLARDGRAGPGSETDVTQGYSSVFLSIKRIGARTSLIADPPNGRVPPLTPEAQKMAAADREFRLAL